MSSPLTPEKLQLDDRQFVLAGEEVTSGSKCWPARQWELEAAKVKVEFERTDDGQGHGKGPKVNVEIATAASLGTRVFIRYNSTRFEEMPPSAMNDDGVNSAVKTPVIVFGVRPGDEMWRSVHRMETRNHKVVILIFKDSSCRDADLYVIDNRPGGPVITPQSNFAAQGPAENATQSGAQLEGKGSGKREREREQ